MGGQISLSDYYRSTSIHSAHGPAYCSGFTAPLPAPLGFPDPVGGSQGLLYSCRIMYLSFCHRFQSLLTQAPRCLPDQAIPEGAIISGPCFQAHLLLSLAPEPRRASTFPRTAWARRSFTLPFPGKPLIFQGQDRMSYVNSLRPPLQSITGWTTRRTEMYCLRGFRRRKPELPGLSAWGP